MSNQQVTNRTRSIPELDTERAERASHVLDLLRGSWTIHLLFAMKGRSVRLSELKRILPAASKKALTASLRSLETAQVIVRRDLSRVSLHVEYEISEPMRDSIESLLAFVSDWAAFLPDAQNTPGIPVAKREPIKSRSP